nr:septal ring lytic transglycosylase RlpA family protein [Maricaulis parjimensis]
MARSSGHQKVGNPYSVAGRTYYPARNDRYDEIGIASWYGPNFHGRPTANGEHFDQNLMTAAHTTLPIPSIAEVTNLENGRSIIVRINDRGPFVDDRIIDLSRAAATELDYIGRGLAQVRVRYLGPALEQGAPPPRTWYAANEAAPSPAPEPATQYAQAVSEPVPQTPAWIPEAGERFTLQIGAFSDPDNAQRFASRIESAGQVWVQPGQSGNAAIYRVYFGRWSDEGSAHAARSTLADWGVYDARIVDLH